MKLPRALSRLFNKHHPSRPAPLPAKAAAIYAEWIIKEGGFQVAAWTDDKATPYLAIKTLNRIGKTTGIYDWQRGADFLSDMVAGFVDGRPIVVRLAATVTSEGLSLLIRLPCGSALNFEEKRFTPWGSGEPTVSITLTPTVDHYAVNSFPTSSQEGDIYA